MAGPRAASALGAVEMDKNHTKGLGESEHGLPGAPQGARSKGALWRTPPSTPSAPPPAPPLSRSPPYHLLPPGVAALPASAPSGRWRGVCSMVLLRVLQGARPLPDVSGQLSKGP